METTIIQTDPEVLGGTPVFRGTRVPIQALFDYLENSTVEEFLIGYPHITREMVNEVISPFVRVFPEDAQEYVNQLRDNDRF